ncbi:MAG: hypothetical protein JWN07_652 [Hyphomicrobiales bacterium]|nr:hypothetical protein [Hyphomicrobiales bacterium]
MRKTILTAAAALLALTTLPVAAQTQGQTYAIGPSDFMQGYAQTGRTERRWQADPTFYEEEGYAPRGRRLVDCERFAYRDDPRCFVR